MQGNFTSESDIVADFTRRKEVVEAEAKRERDEKRAKRAEVKAKVSKRVHRDAAQEVMDDEGAAAGQEREAESLLMLPAEEYGPVYFQSETQFFSTCEPIDLLVTLMIFLEERQMQHKVSSEQMQISLPLQMPKKDGSLLDVTVLCQVLQVSDKKSCLLFKYTDRATGEKIANSQTTQHYLSILSDESMKILCDATFTSDD